MAKWRAGRCRKWSVKSAASSMRRVASHPEADQELEAAAVHYDKCRPGLGNDFLDDFEATVRRILDAPDRWRKIRGENWKLKNLFQNSQCWTSGRLRTTARTRAKGC
jgi:hypothetical protein